MTRARKTRRTTKPAPPAYETPDGAQRPTAERLARGTWAHPQGALRSQQPAVDMASDQIGALYHGTPRQITTAQFNAARHFQTLRGVYLREFPEIEGFKSCIGGAVPGHDDGDGSPAAMAAYRTIEARLTRLQRSEVLWVCDQNHQPRNLAVLCGALDVLGG